MRKIFIIVTLILSALTIQSQIKADILLFKSKLFIGYYKSNMRQGLYDSLSVRRYSKLDTFYCENGFTLLDSTRATIILFVAPTTLSATNKRNAIKIY